MFIDTESMCWENNKSTGPIIEVGYCFLYIDSVLKKCEISKPKSYFVKPYIYNDVDYKIDDLSEFCTNLTGITKKNLSKSAFSFDKIIAFIIRDGGNSVTWGGYGDDKTKILKYSMYKELGLKPPASYLDVSLLLNYKLMNSYKYSLENALKLIGLEFEGVPHRAGVDAYNTARLFKGFFYE